MWQYKKNDPERPAKDCLNRARLFQHSKTNEYISLINITKQQSLGVSKIQDAIIEFDQFNPIDGQNSQ